MSLGVTGVDLGLLKKSGINDKMVIGVENLMVVVQLLEKEYCSGSWKIKAKVLRLTTKPPKSEIGFAVEDLLTGSLVDEELSAGKIYGNLEVERRAIAA